MQYAVSANVRASSQVRERVKGKLPALLSLTVALSLPSFVDCQPAAANRSRVFILQSYHPELAWTENVTSGINEVFLRSGMDVELQSDYLDARRYPQKELISEASSLIEKRIIKFKPDLLIACDNAALSFALARRTASFPGIPVVFCGINSFHPALLAGEANITGVPEDVSILDTVRLALRLHPGVKRIIVSGRAAVAADAANRDAFKEALPSLPSEVSVEFWDDLPLPELRRRLALLGRDTIVFINGLAADENGRELMYDQTTALIRQNSGVPLYSLWDVDLGYGIVGGKLVSGRKQGELAASIAIRILKGESADGIPVVGAQDANQYMFDMQELRRFRISRTALPTGSVIVNDTLAPLLRYWWVFLIIGVFVVLETAVIVVLVMAIRLLRSTQKKLRTNEQRLELALSGADLGIWDWEVESGRTAFNDRWAEMLGYRLDEIVQNVDSWRTLIHPDDRQKVENALSRHLNDETPIYEAEHRLRHKNGQWVWVLTKGRVIERDDEGRALRACGTHLDITERKLAEERRLDLERQLLHSQKLESLGLLAGGIAHDFNNLLTAILGNLDLVSSDLPDSTEAHLCVTAAIRATQKAADLARQMLAFSGKGRFVNKAIDLNSFIRENSDLLRTSISKTIWFELRLDDNPAVVLADPAQLQQVVLNLVTNAAEAIGSGHGTITAVTGSMDCDQHYFSESLLQEKPAEGRYAYLEIKDTGCGMDAETLRRLFEPYFSSKGVGRGLGMAAVLGIVKGHRGAIMVDSRVGSGTTVRVLLPAADAAAGSRETVAAAGGAEESVTPPLTGLVLVVDDEEPIRMLAQRALEKLGLRVQTTADSDEALAFFREHAGEISLVLLDFTLPTMDGAAVFREMKTIKADAKVILSSGYNQQEVTQRLAGSGLAGFVQKPYLIATLQREIRRVCGAA